MLQVTLSTGKEVIYEGLADSVLLPGEYGEFEILPFQTPIMSVLKSGKLRIDNLFFDIRGGIAKMNETNELLLLVD